MQTTCPECGAYRESRATCEELFHQMLYWENEKPERGAVHHLMVLAYHLQHPSLYSPEGLLYSMRLLVDFVEQNISPRQMRKLRAAEVNSGMRKWNIKARSGAHGAYRRPVRWSMRAEDVVSSGAEKYNESVSAWARSILADLRASGNLE